MPKPRIAILIAIILTASIFGYTIKIRSANSSGFTAGFQLGDFDIKENGEYSTVEIDEIGRESNPGEPDVPIASEYILLSDYTPIVEVTYFTTDTVFAAPPKPVDVPRFESGEPDGVFPGESSVYNSSETFPANIANVDPVGISRGYKLGLLSIYPVRYDFRLGAYLIHKKAEISVDLGGTVREPAENLRSEPFARMLATYTLNGNVMPSTLPDDPGTYLIITPDNCWEVMEDFVTFKRSRGHRVVHKRLSELGSPPTKDDIKAFIQDRYDNMNPAPTFVILVGDIDMSDGTEVPDYNYGYYYSGHGYSLLEGEDYFSDVFYGRWTIDNINECRIYANKVKWYETSPTSGGSDWLSRAAVVSTYDHAVTPVWNVLWVYELLLRNGYTTVDSFFEMGSSIPSPSEIAAPINDGLAYIDYRGWAGSNGWWEPEFTVTDVMTLSNSEAYPVVVSIVCGTGDYGAFTDPCFGEAWLRAGTVTNPKGGVAFFGTTDHDTHTRYNNPINGGFFTSLFVHDLPHIGQADWLAKAEILRLHPHEEEHIELYFHSYQTLGDPGLMMQRNIPGTLEVTHDPVQNGGLVKISVSESGLPVEDATVSMYRIETDESSIAHTNFMGETELYTPGSGAGTVVITVYAPFHTTYVDTVEVSGRPGLSIVDVAVEDTIEGDDDGVLDPNEIAVLRLTIENYYYLAISPVEGYLWADHRGVSVMEEFDSVTVDGYSENELVFKVQSSGEATGGGPAVMQLLCDSRNGRTVLPFELELPPGGITVDSIHIEDSPGGDGDGTLEPGETATAAVLLTNHGSGEIAPFALNVYSTSGWTSISDGDSIIMPTISPMSSTWSSDFTLAAHEEAFHGYPVGVEVHYYERDKYINTISLSLGTRNSDDPQGSDAWGYFAYDNTDVESGITPGAFEDISSSGTFVELGDDEKIELQIPFDFVYYGESYDTLTVCSNGWAAPGIQPYFMLDFYNLPIPGPNGPWGTLAIFWDDLEPLAGGGIYWEDRGDQLIVQWEEMGHARFDGVSNTFQLVIYDPAVHTTRTGDSPIEFRYSGSIEDVDSLEEYSTVGIESPDNGMGIECLFSTTYDDGAPIIGDGTAIRFTTNCGSALLTGNVDLDGDVPTSAIVSADLGQIARPDFHGDWRLLELPAGEHVLTCKAPYYFPRAESLTLAADEHADVDFMLTQIPIPDTITASQSVLSEITISWPSAPPSELPLTGYRLLKYYAPGGKPEIIETTDTFYVDTEAERGRKYFYRVKYDYSGYHSAPSELIEGWREINTGMEEADLPDKLSLKVSPNPFNAVMQADIQVPQGESAKLEIFNILGQRLFTRDNILNGKIILWPEKNTCNEPPSGIYLVRLYTETQSICKRAVLLK